MSRIEKLTIEQESKLSEYRDKWLSIGLSTSPTDRKKAEEIIDEVYLSACLAKPKFKIWIQSPYKGAIAAGMLPQIFKHGAQVMDQVRNQVWDQVRNQVRNQVWDQVRNQVRNQVMDQVRNQVWDQVGDQVGVQVWNQVGRSAYGLHDAGWLGFYDFFAKVLGFKCCSKLIPLMNLSEVCGWWWPFENVVILTEKPVELHRDARNRLHNLNGHAISYSDGWGVYAIHGVRVPEKYIVTPADKIDPKEVLAEPNAEVRTAVIKKCGFQHFLKHLKAKKISKSENGKAELLEFDLGNGMIVRGLHVWWDDKAGHKETVIPVPRTKKQFESTGDIPEDIDDAESVRRWTLFAGKDDRFLAET